MEVFFSSHTDWSAVLQDLGAKSFTESPQTFVKVLGWNEDLSKNNCSEVHEGVGHESSMGPHGSRRTLNLLVFHLSILLAANYLDRMIQLLTPLKELPSTAIQLSFLLSCSHGPQKEKSVPPRLSWTHTDLYFFANRAATVLQLCLSVQDQTTPESHS